MALFAVGGDSLVGAIDLEPMIAAFFLVLAAPVVGLVAWLVARRRTRRGRAFAWGFGSALLLLAVAAGCTFGIWPLANIARWVVNRF